MPSGVSAIRARLFYLRMLLVVMKMRLFIKHRGQRRG